MRHAQDAVTVINPRMLEIDIGRLIRTRARGNDDFRCRDGLDPVLIMDLQTVGAGKLGTTMNNIYPVARIKFGT